MSAGLPAVKWLLVLSILSYMVLYNRIRRRLPTSDLQGHISLTTMTTSVDSHGPASDRYLSEQYSPAGPPTGSNDDAGGTLSTRSVARNIGVAAALERGSSPPNLDIGMHVLDHESEQVAQHLHSLSGVPPPYVTTATELKRRQCIQEALRKALAFHQHPFLMNRKGCKDGLSRVPFFTLYHSCPSFWLGLDLEFLY